MISREQLYQEVWSEPMTKVAARYGVSSSYLGRVCNTLAVPRPARGHWAKSRGGKASGRPPLLDVPIGHVSAWSRSGEVVTCSDAMPVLPPDARRRATPRELPAFHPLLAGAKAHFEAGRETDGYLRPFKHKLVDVFTSKEALERALATANAIFGALEARGYRVGLATAGSSYQRPPIDPREKPSKAHYFGPSWSPSTGTVVLMGTLGIGLSLYELSEHVPVFYRGGQYVRLDSRSPRRASRSSAGSWTTQKDLPSGRMCLHAYCPHGFASWTKEWREDTPGDLNERATKIARELRREAPAILVLIQEGKRRAELEHRRWEEERLAWERAETKRKRAETVETSRRELMAAISSWGQASRIEAFFKDVETRMNGLPDQGARDALREKLRLGRELLGTIDPLKDFRAWRTPEEREGE